MRHRFVGLAALLALGGGLLGGGGTARAEPDPGHASCMGLGSSFYAHFATTQRALVAHIVHDDISPVPGEHYRVFAQEKEGGSIPSPCGTRIE